MHALTRQLKAAQAQYDNAHEDDAQRYEDAQAKRADAAEHSIYKVSHADGAREWAGMENSKFSVYDSLAEGRRLAAIFGSDWTEGLPF